MLPCPLRRRLIRCRHGNSQYHGGEQPWTATIAQILQRHCQTDRPQRKHAATHATALFEQYLLASTLRPLNSAGHCLSVSLCRRMPNATPWSVKLSLLSASDRIQCATSWKELRSVSVLRLVTHWVLTAHARSAIRTLSSSACGSWLVFLCLSFGAVTFV